MDEVRARACLQKNPTAFLERLLDCWSPPTIVTLLNRYFLRLLCKAQSRLKRGNPANKAEVARLPLQSS